MPSPLRAWDLRSITALVGIGIGSASSGALDLLVFPGTFTMPVKTDEYAWTELDSCSFFEKPDLQ